MVRSVQPIQRTASQNINWLQTLIIESISNLFLYCGLLHQAFQLSCNKPTTNLFAQGTAITSLQDMNSRVQYPYISYWLHLIVLLPQRKLITRYDYDAFHSLNNSNPVGATGTRIRCIRTRWKLHALHLCAFSNSK